MIHILNCSVISNKTRWPTLKGDWFF